jgi:hypothetical protein
MHSHVQTQTKMTLSLLIFCSIKICLFFDPVESLGCTVTSVHSCRCGESVSLNCDHKRAYCSSPRYYMSLENHGGMMLVGQNRKTLREACPSATVSTRNSTCTGPGANPGLRGKRPEPWHGFAVTLIKQL